MDIFAEQNSLGDSDIPDKIPPYQLTNAERAAILQPNLLVDHADLDDTTGPASNLFERVSEVNANLYDTMCGEMSLTLRRNYRLLASFRVMGVKQQNYQRGLAEVKGKAAFMPLIGPNNRLSAVFILDLSLVSALFEVACGGVIRAGKLPEFQLEQWNTRLLIRLLEPLANIWADGSNIETIDAAPEFSQSLAPNKVIEKVEFSAKFGGVMGRCFLLREASA